MPSRARPSSRSSARYFHGNNKSRTELEEALQAGVGRVVIDNFQDIELLNEVALAAGKRQARAAARDAGRRPAHALAHHDRRARQQVRLRAGRGAGRGRHASARSQPKASTSLGLHCHIGSQLFEHEPYAEAIDKVLAFAAEMAQKHGLDFREFSPGGGIGIQYTRDEASAAAQPASPRRSPTAVKGAVERYGLKMPHVVVEPGRSIVGRAGVALYTVGSRKDVPGVRTYVAVDGGMADNIRPAIYGSKYEALSAARPAAPSEETVTIVGKYCESGDVLVRDIALPRLEAGEVLAIPASGAYCLAMASNYNMALKPASRLRVGRPARASCAAARPTPTSWRWTWTKEQAGAVAKHRKLYYT